MATEYFCNNLEVDEPVIYKRGSHQFAMLMTKSGFKLSVVVKNYQLDDVKLFRKLTCKQVKRFVHVNYSGKS